MAVRLAESFRVSTLLMLPRYSGEGSLLKRIVEPLGLPTQVGERQSLIHRCLSCSVDGGNNSGENSLNVRILCPFSKILDPIRVEDCRLFGIVNGSRLLPLDDFVQRLLSVAEVPGPVYFRPSRGGLSPDKMSCRCQSVRIEELWPLQGGC